MPQIYSVYIDINNSKWWTWFSKTEGIPKKIEGEKKRGIYGERKRKDQADVVESHRQAALQREIMKRPRKKKVTMSNKETTGMPLLWTC